jgi:hypothetical protein
VVATWGHREQFRYFHDKFGLGTPRLLFELPAFSKWKRAVYTAAEQLALSQEDMKRIEVLLGLFGEHKHRRADMSYNVAITWLENAEGEYDRKPFAGIVAAANPRQHSGVLVADQLDGATSRWNYEHGFVVERTAMAFSTSLASMLSLSRQVHVVDPHFDPSEPRFRNVLVALTKAIVDNGGTPEVVRVHCSDKLSLSFFQFEANKMARHIPSGLSVEFVRWREKPGGEDFHNRFVLTEIGGVSFGVGLDEGSPGQTDDLNLLTKKPYQLRWSQFIASSSAFEFVDEPRAIVGTKPR